MNPSVRTEALDIPGATSADVNTGIGKPIQGLEGREVAAQVPGKKHTDERQHPVKRKKEETGLAGVGANAKDPVREHGWDLPEGVEKGSTDPELAGAEEREPVTADQLAAERD